MLRIGITGHTNLTDDSAALIYEALVAALRRHTRTGIRGVTCLAGGADQLFAEAVQAVGGTYEVILPARDYRARAIAPENRARFDALIDRAAAVTRIDLDESGEAAFAAANAELIKRSDRLMAVWDGRMTGSTGGTTHAVAAARQARLAITRIWPAGALRTARPAVMTAT